jgi:hypothetical protein
MKHFFSFGIITFFVIMSYSIFAQINNTKLTGQSFKGEVTVNATPDMVWTVLTDISKLSKVGGFEYQGAEKRLTKVGDNVKLKVFGDEGTFILSFVKPNVELRYTWEPDNASYLCQERWQLIPSGKETKVIFEDRYTESSPQTSEDISYQVESYNETLSKLKTLVEK